MNKIEQGDMEFLASLHIKPEPMPVVDRHESVRDVFETERQKALERAAQPRGGNAEEEEDGEGYKEAAQWRGIAREMEAEADVARRAFRAITLICPLAVMISGLAGWWLRGMQ